MTYADFVDVFSMLAMQLRATDADEAMGKAYFAALIDLDLELVQMAALVFSRELGRNDGWFPKAPEWRVQVAKITAERTEELRSRLRSRPAPLCRACEDTSWAPHATGVIRCDCQELRRLEIIGRRPMPERVIGAIPERPHALAELTAMIRPKAMPTPRPTDTLRQIAAWRSDPTLDRDDPIIAAELEKSRIR